MQRGKVRRITQKKRLRFLSRFLILTFFDFYPNISLTSLSAETLQVSEMGGVRLVNSEAQPQATDTGKTSKKKGIPLKVVGLMVLVVVGLVAVVIFVVIPKFKARGTPSTTTTTTQTATASAEQADEDEEAASAAPAATTTATAGSVTIEQVTRIESANTIILGEWPDKRRLKLKGVKHPGLGPKISPACEAVARRLIGSQVRIDASEGDEAVVVFPVVGDGPSINAVLLISGYAFADGVSGFVGEAGSLATENQSGVQREDLYKGDNRAPTPGEIQADLSRAAYLLETHDWENIDAQFMGEKLAAKHEERKQEAQAQATET